MIPVLLFVSIVLRAIFWQTEIGFIGMKIIYWTVSVYTAYLIYRDRELFSRLTFWFVPALLLVVMSISGGRAAPPPEWLPTGDSFFGHEMRVIAGSPAHLRYMSLVFFDLVYIIASLRYNRETLAKILVYSGWAVYAGTLAQVVMGLRPELLIVQKPTYAATLAALLLPASETIADNNLRRIYRAWGMIAVMLYGAQTGWVMVFAYLGYNVLRSVGWRITFPRAAVLGLVGTGGVLGVARAFTWRTFIDRTYYWRAALQDAANNPVLGIGPGRFQHYGLSSMPAFSAHSVPLTVLSEAGLTGFAVVLLLVAMIVGTRRKRPDWANQILGLAGGAFLLADGFWIWPISAVVAMALATTPPDNIGSEALMERYVVNGATQWYYINKTKKFLIGFASIVRKL